MFTKFTKYILVLWVFFTGFSASAQCAMCRAALESEGDDSKAEALNNGIVYLMAFPYIMVAIVFYVVYRMKFKKKPQTEASSWLFNPVNLNIHLATPFDVSQYCFIG